MRVSVGRCSFQDQLGCVPRWREEGQVLELQWGDDITKVHMWGHTTRSPSPQQRCGSPGFGHVAAPQMASFKAPEKRLWPSSKLSPLGIGVSPEESLLPSCEF